MPMTARKKRKPAKRRAAKRPRRARRPSRRGQGGGPQDREAEDQAQDEAQGHEAEGRQENHEAQSQAQNEAQGHEAQSHEAQGHKAQGHEAEDQAQGRQEARRRSVAADQEGCSRGVRAAYAQGNGRGLRQEALPRLPGGRGQAHIRRRRQEAAIRARNHHGPASGPEASSRHPLRHPLVPAPIIPRRARPAPRLVRARMHPRVNG